MSAFESALKSPSFQYTAEELSAIRQVRDALLAAGVDESRIGLKTLAFCTINTKLRVEETRDKYLKWLEAIGVYGLTSLSDSSIVNPTALPFLRSYAPSGVDKEGRQILWIKGGTVTEAEEALSVSAGIAYFIAVHADAVSLREGITFVIDVSLQRAEKVGNEGKLQKTWQSFPLRPQAIRIAGAGFIKRTIINGLITVAAFFTKQKILDRIRFVSVEEVVAELPIESVPKYLNGGGGGLSDDLSYWVQERIANFPVPVLEV